MSMSARSNADTVTGDSPLVCTKSTASAQVLLVVMLKVVDMTTLQSTRGDYAVLICTSVVFSEAVC